MKKQIRNFTIKHYAHFALGTFGYVSTFLSVLPNYTVTESTVLYAIITAYAWAAAVRYERKLNRAKHQYAEYKALSAFKNSIHN